MHSLSTTPSYLNILYLHLLILPCYLIAYFQSALINSKPISTYKVINAIQTLPTSKVNLLTLFAGHPLVNVMKMLTHIILTFALSSLICSLIFKSVWVLNDVFILSLIINYLIDVLGHKGGRRTPLTHEVVNNVFISLCIGLGVYIFTSYTIPHSLLTLVITSITASSTHLLLDSMTGGIYVLDNTSRFVLYEKRYDDFTLNTLIIALSSIIIVAVLILIL